MARPTKFSKKNAQQIIDAIGIGAPYEIAAGFGGVSYNTFNNWMKRGKAEEERLREEEVLIESGLIDKPDKKTAKEEAKFLEFFEQVEEAKANDAIASMQVIDTASKRDPSWAAWKLARRYPGLFDPKIQIQSEAVLKNDITVNATTTVHHKIDEDDIDRIASILAILESAGAIPARSDQAGATETN